MSPCSGSCNAKKLAPCMGHAGTDLSHAKFETGLVAAEIVKTQLAVSVPQKVANILSGATAA